MKKNKIVLIFFQPLVFYDYLRRFSFSFTKRTGVPTTILSRMRSKNNTTWQLRTSFTHKFKPRRLAHKEKALFVGAVYASQTAQIAPVCVHTQHFVLRLLAMSTSHGKCKCCALALSVARGHRDLPNSDCCQRPIACNGRCRPNNAVALLCANYICTQVQVSVIRTQRKKRTVWFVFLFVGAVTET